MTKIYISPSGQHANIGAYPKGTSEEYWTRLVGDRLNERLKATPGIETRVGADRSYDGYADNARESNAWGAKLHIAIHTNVGRGTMLCVYPGAKDALKLAQSLMQYLGPYTPNRDVIVNRPDLYELNSTNATAVLIELDGHDAPAGVDFIIKSIDAFADQIYRGICSYLGITPQVMGSHPGAQETITKPTGKETNMPNADLWMRLVKRNTHATLAAARAAYDRVGSVPIIQDLADGVTIVKYLFSEILSMRITLDRIARDVQALKPPTPPEDGIIQPETHVTDPNTGI